MSNLSNQILPFSSTSTFRSDAFQRQLARTAGAQQQLRQMSEEQLQAIGARTEQIGEYVRPSPAIELGLIVFGLFGNVLTALTILLSDLIKVSARRRRPSSNKKNNKKNKNLILEFFATKSGRKLKKNQIFDWD